jgi:hypothetical protein
MIDREKVLTVLRRRFPGAPAEQVAAAANAIVGLDDEWDEVAPIPHDVLTLLAKVCAPSRAAREITAFRVLRHKA